MKYQINSKALLLLFLIISVLSCDSEDTSESPELSLSEKLIGEWAMTNYYSNLYFHAREEGRIEKIVPEETDYGIEFTRNQNEIILSGFLRYTWDEYEIVDGEKVITYQATNFMDSEHGEGYHTGNWKIENELLICTDVSSQEGIEYATISSIEFSGDNLKLTLENSQFGTHLEGETIVEYIRK
jgi:hypothetical protein